MKLSDAARRSAFALICLGAVFAGGAIRAVQDACGPFTDVSSLLCPYVLEAYYTGITAGTSPTTFSPDVPITRGQAAVFVTKGLNQALSRSSRRAALGQWCTTTPYYSLGLGVTPVGNDPEWVTSDGTDLWVANRLDGTISRVRASDGRVLETWSGVDRPLQTVVALGKVFVLSQGVAGGLYLIDPSQPAGAAVLAAPTDSPAQSVSFDGSRFWVSTGRGSFGTINIIVPGPTMPWSVTTVTGSPYSLFGEMIFDGSAMWLVVQGSQMLRFDPQGNVTQVVALGYPTGIPTFDGTNFWVPSGPDSLYIVRASSGSVVATLHGNGLVNPNVAAFDGQRVLVTNANVDSVSLWSAADLAPLGSFPTSSGVTTVPFGACSDGVNFWVTLTATNQLVRF